MNLQLNRNDTLFVQKKKNCRNFVFNVKSEYADCIRSYQKNTNKVLCLKLILYIYLCFMPNAVVKCS